MKRLSIVLMLSSLGGVASAHSLDPSLIRAAIHKQQPGFKRCFEDALKRDPAVHGKATLTFVVDVNKPLVVAIEGELGDAELERCVVAEAKQIVFPAFAENVRLSYPLVFKTE